MIASKHLYCCRLCDSERLHLLLDLGETALANRFLTAEQLDQPEPKFPLRLVQCERCGLVQIDETVPPSVLFSHYVYVSGTSELIHRHADWLTRTATERYHLQSGDFVLELASNDGTVLKAFQRRHFRVLGVEPAVNIMHRANHEGIPTIGAFFNESIGKYVRQSSGPAKLILARHVLAHVAELHSFVAGIRTALADDGIALVEVPYLLPFFQNVEFDTIYHEHLCYFSVQTLQALGRRFGLELVDVQEVEIHGGSIVAAFRPNAVAPTIWPTVEEFLHREQACGLNRPEAWSDFADSVQRVRTTLWAEIDRLCRKGKKLAGYGAAAKAMTLLAFAGIGVQDLPYIVDRNPLKQGLFTPGHHIPVCGPERLQSDPPDVLILLAWNFAREIVAQQAAFAQRGGRFLVPIPTAHYLEASVRLAG